MMSLNTEPDMVYMMPGRRWIEEDDEQLRYEYLVGRSSVVDIASLLNRSIWAIKHEVSKLGISRSREWTMEEDERLRHEYLDNQAHEVSIASNLGRSVIAIRNRVVVLGIHRSREWTEEEKAFLRDNAAGMFGWQMGAVLGKTSSAVKNMCRKLDIRLPSFLPPVMIGEENPSWSGDECGRIGQHIRAINDVPNIEDFWCIPCLLRYGIYKKAEERARMDHTNLPYRKEYVLPMCKSCNQRHSANHFVILFLEV